MKKISKLLNVLLLSMPLVSLTTSCDENNVDDKKVEFNFNDEYFIGMQEHFYEIRSMAPSINTDFICDLNEAIGSKVFRINVTMNNLFYVDRNDTVRFNEATKANFHRCIEQLQASGVERIVYANDSFIYPYGYSYTHTICVPDPYSERDAYERWLKVNSTGYGMMAKEFPEIEYFEPINEPDLPTGEVLCKNGMSWGMGSSSPQFIYSAEDEAHIVADLCYYIRKEIKAANPNSKMMTPALTSLTSAVTYLDEIYKAIESGAHPIGKDDPCCVDPDEYFDIIDYHPYSFVCANIDPATPTSGYITLVTENYAKACMQFYDICVAHGDAEKPHWYTELGFTDYGVDSDAETAGREAAKQMKIIKEELPFVECIIFYKMCDFYKPEYTVSTSEDHFGLLTAPSDPEKPLQLKPIMKEIYKFMHNGSEDYSAFDAVRAKYCSSK